MLDAEMHHVQEALTDADEISGYKVRTHDFLPFTISESLDMVRGDTHSPELCEGPDTLLHQSELIIAPNQQERKPSYLEDDGTLEYNEHKSGKEGIVPILVQTP